MTPLETVGLTFFIFVLFAGTFSTVFGIPGTVIILMDVIFYAFITGFERIGLKIIIILVIISILAEAIDFAFRMAGAARFGISKQRFWIAVISSLVGAIAMTPVLFGLGSIIGIFLGGFGGLLIVEIIRQSMLKPALRAGYKAILGRVAVTLVKGFCAIIMTIISLSNIYS